MTWLQSILLGIVGGVSRVLPISAQAHEVIFRNILGIPSADPIFTLLMDLAVLIALFTACRKDFLRIRRERTSSRSRKSMMQRQLSNGAMFLVITFAALMLLSRSMRISMPVAGLQLLIVGMLLYFSGRTPQGNKDSRNFSPMDVLCVGVGAGIGGIGLSGTAGALAAGRIRGAGRQFSLTFALLLAMVAQGCALVSDVIAIAAGAAFQPALLLRYIIAAGLCYFFARTSVTALRNLAVRTGFSGFAYYCWGAGLLCFILYLSV